MKKQNLNTEDILLCKKDYLIYSVVVFHKNKYYYNRFNKSHVCCTICDDDSFEHLLSYDEVSEHFYTKQEVRKIKLKKLNECQ